jgi:diadenosine tetraphosphatase ApaH/serine/threonine PP2A family protein phosphatase
MKAATTTQAFISENIVFAQQPVRVGEAAGSFPFAGSVGVHEPEALKKVKSIPSSHLNHEQHLREKNYRGLLKRVSSFAFSPPPKGAPFNLLKLEHFLELCELLIQSFKGSSCVARVNAPAKVFGDIHGQFSDMLDLFSCFGWPTRYRGDIEGMTYVFNGDFVDRGNHSLEVVAFLFACKLVYPKNIVLVRGNHELNEINCEYGFLKECKGRLGDYDGERLWIAINKVFGYLPLVCVISDKIAVMHGGIGRKEWSIADLQNRFKIPISSQTIDESDMLTNILWSDPTRSDDVIGVHANNRSKDKIVEFPSDAVSKFCQSNDLDLVFRSHQCVMAGYELFAGGKMCTVFSAANYCDSCNNNSACIVVATSLECTVKVMITSVQRNHDYKMETKTDVSLFSSEFNQILKKISAAEISRHEILQKMSESKNPSESVIAKAVTSLLTSYSSALTKTRTVVVVQPDVDKNVVGERLTLACSFLRCGDPIFPLLGQYGKEMESWLVERCKAEKNSLVILEMKSFSNGASMVVDAVLTIRDYIRANFTTCELLVITSDFNYKRVKAAYESAFPRSNVRVLQTQSTKDLYSTRIALEEANFSRTMGVLNAYIQNVQQDNAFMAKTRSSVKSCGCLPFAVVNGKIAFLLGYSRGRKCWESFGGGREAWARSTNTSGLEDLEWTAVRETCEETLGLVGGSVAGGGCKALFEKLKLSPLPVLCTETYATFLLHIQFNDALPRIFDALKSPESEVQYIAWVLAEDLVSAIRAMNPTQNVVDLPNLKGSIRINSSWREGIVKSLIDSMLVTFAK